MSKKKVVRVAAFVGALCASAALVGTAASSTGAYFSDSKSGTLQANSGHLTLNIDPATSTTLNYADLMPGVDQTLPVHYGANVSGGTEDVWLVFPNSLAYDQFTGAKGVTDWPGGGLGRYGHFKVTSNQGYNFESYNLQNLPTGSSDPVCYVDGVGNGGSNTQATAPGTAGEYPNLCGVPQAIKIGDNLATGQDGTVSITFGLTGRWKGQNVALSNVPFQVVGTQHGVRPDALNF